LSYSVTLPSWYTFSSAMHLRSVVFLLVRNVTWMTVRCSPAAARPVQDHHLAFVNLEINVLEDDQRLALNILLRALALTCRIAEPVPSSRRSVRLRTCKTRDMVVMAMGG
jgi:hypothetical protein